MGFVAFIYLELCTSSCFAVELLMVARRATRCRCRLEWVPFRNIGHSRESGNDCTQGCRRLANDTSSGDGLLALLRVSLGPYSSPVDASTSATGERKLLRISDGFGLS
jgi:hypothetical protein